MDARPAWHGAVTPAGGSAAMPMPAAGALSRGAPARKPPLAAAGDAGRFAGDAGRLVAPSWQTAGGVLNLRASFERTCFVAHPFSALTGSRRAHTTRL